MRKTKLFCNIKNKKKDAKRFKRNSLIIILSLIIPFIFLKIMWPCFYFNLLVFQLLFFHKFLIDLFIYSSIIAIYLFFAFNFCIFILTKKDLRFLYCYYCLYIFITCIFLIDCLSIRACITIFIFIFYDSVQFIKSFCSISLNFNF